MNGYYPDSFYATFRYQHPGPMRWLTVLSEDDVQRKAGNAAGCPFCECVIHAEWCRYGETLASSLDQLSWAEWEAWRHVTPILGPILHRFWRRMSGYERLMRRVGRP